jgi:hypothetical protein
MKKQIYLTMLAVCLSFLANSQTVIPSSDPSIEVGNEWSKEYEIKKLEPDADKCRTCLLNYFNWALLHQPGDNLRPEILDIMKYLRNCHRYGKYNSMPPFKIEELVNLTKIQKKVSKKRGLSFKKVNKYLKGEDEKVLGVGNPDLMSVENGY